jgi:D-inositol-3-phosphate glycosyltransferase
MLETDLIERACQRGGGGGTSVSAVSPQSSAIHPPNLKIALLTGGDDKPYVLGLVPALTATGLHVDVIGSDDLSVPELLNEPRVNFLNLRGNQTPDASLCAKVARLVTYYWRLMAYAARPRAKVLHILWNNKFELFDRTLLMFYYRLMGKRLVLTAHNVNMRKRDGTDDWLNRFSLKIQYWLADHIFVHTQAMRAELVSEFAISGSKVSVIPFGINNTVPSTDITVAEAKRMLGISQREKVLLSYGQIAPYKGVEYLISAFAELLKKDATYRLIIAGKPKWNEIYWNQLQEQLTQSGVRDKVIERIEHVPDAETQLYFKAADVLVLPYRRIFQSGVIFLAYSFGLPVIGADVGSLKEEIIEGQTGFVCKAQDSADLARVITKYFDSELYQNLEARRPKIKKYANERYSWDKVAGITTSIYSELLGKRSDNVVATSL